MQDSDYSEELNDESSESSYVDQDEGVSEEKIEDSIICELNENDTTQDLKNLIAKRVIQFFMENYNQSQKEVTLQLRNLFKQNNLFVLEQIQSYLKSDIFEQNEQKNIDFLYLLAKFVEEIIIKFGEQDHELKKQLKIFIQFQMIQQCKAEQGFCGSKQKDFDEEFLDQRRSLIEEICLSLLKLNQNFIFQLTLELYDYEAIPPIFLIRILKLQVSELKESVHLYIRELLQKCLTSIQKIKSERLILEFCDFLSEIYQNLQLYLENAQQFQDDQIQKNSSESQINLQLIQDMTLQVFNIVKGQWTSKSSDNILKSFFQQNSQCKLKSMSLLGSVIQFIPLEILNKQIDSILKEYVSLLKSQSLDPEICAGFNKVLERIQQMFAQEQFERKKQYEEILKGVLISISELTRKPTLSSNYPFNHDLFQEKNRLLKILENLGLIISDQVIDFFMVRFQSKDLVEKISSLWVGNFLVSRLYEKWSVEIISKLFSNLVGLIQQQNFDENLEVMYIVLEYILSISKQAGFKNNLKEGGKLVLSESQESIEINVNFILEYVIQNCAIHDDLIKDHPEAVIPYITNLELLKKRGQFILNIFCSDPQLEFLIWPNILEPLINQKKSCALPYILNCLSQFSEKFNADKNMFLSLRESKLSNNKLPNFQQLFSRFFVLLRMPNFFESLGKEILNFLPHLVQIFLQQECSAFIKTCLNEMKFQQKNNSQKYLELIFVLWQKVLDQIQENLQKNQSVNNSSYSANLWFQTLHEDITTIAEQYKTKEELAGHIAKLHGVLLSKINNLEIIKYQINKFFFMINNDYVGHQINLNIQYYPPHPQNKEEILQAISFVAESQCDFVLEIVLAFSKTEIVQKKNKSGLLNNSFFGILTRSEEGEDRKLDLQITSIQLFSIIINRIPSKIFLEKIDFCIKSFLIPQMNSQVPQINQEVQKSIKNISKRLEQIVEEFDLENEGEVQGKQYQNILVKYRRKFIEKSKQNVLQIKNDQIIGDGWFSICYLLRLQSFQSMKLKDQKESDLTYEEFINFFGLCLEQIVKLKDFQKEIFSELIQSLLIFRKLFKEEYFVSQQKVDGQQLNEIKVLQDQDQEQIISCFNTLSTILVSLFEFQDFSFREEMLLYIECFQEALGVFKHQLKEEDKKSFFYSYSLLLSFVFLNDVSGEQMQLNQKNKENIQKFSSQASLCCEKLLLSTGCSINLNNLNKSSLIANEILDIILSNWTEKDVYQFIQECLRRSLESKEVLSVKGFLFLYGEYGFRQRQKLIQLQQKDDQNNFQQIQFYQEISTSFFEKCEQVFDYLTIELGFIFDESDQEIQKLKEIFLGYLDLDLGKNLDDLIVEKVEFPLSEYHLFIIKCITLKQSTTLKSFNYLTNVLNNPEEIVLRHKGNGLTNASIYLGQILQIGQNLIQQLAANKFFYQILGTILIRFSTSFDYRFEPTQNEPSKITLWLLEQFLTYTNKSYILNEFSQGLLYKIINDDQFEDGIQEIIMIISKNSSFQQLQSLVEFLKPFINKKIDSQRRLAFAVFSQLITCTHLTMNFEVAREDKQQVSQWYIYLINTLIENSQDVSEKIRKIIYQGLGCVSLLLKHQIAQNEQQNSQEPDKEEQREKQNTEVIQDTQNNGENQHVFKIKNETYGIILEVLYQGMEDSCENCIAVAMNSLQNVIDFVEESYAESFVVGLMVKIMVCFEKPSEKIRGTAFNLFGKLIDKFSEKCDGFLQFKEHFLYLAYLAVIVHLMDESLQVKNICVQVIQKLDKIIPKTQQNKPPFTLDQNIFHKNEIQIAQLLYQIDLSNFNTENCILNLLEYSKSPQSQIKAASILAVFVLISKYQEIHQFQIKKQVLQNVLEILSDDNPKIIQISFLLKASLFFLTPNSNI